MKHWYCYLTFFLCEYVFEKLLLFLLSILKKVVSLQYDLIEIKKKQASRAFLGIRPVFFI